MDGHSSHLTAPIRSRSSQSPSPSHSASASASVSSSARKRKLASEDQALAFLSSLSDTRDGALTSNDELESISARGAETYSEDDSEEVVNDDDDDGSTRTFTTARLKSNANLRNSKLKMESSSVKVDSSAALSEVGKEERGMNAGLGLPPPGALSSISGIVAKEDTMKSVFTENLQISGAYIAREESFKREKEVGIPKKVIKVEDIPGLREAGWTPDQWGHSRFRTLSACTDSASYRQSLNAFMRSLIKEPVDGREVPDYYDVIKDPMDLKTMSKRLESEQYYVTFEMFIADAKKMFSNARTYNSPDTIYYKCATKLETHFSHKVQAGLQSFSKLQQ